MFHTCSLFYRKENQFLARVLEIFTSSLWYLFPKNLMYTIRQMQCINNLPWGQKAPSTEIPNMVAVDQWLIGGFVFLSSENLNAAIGNFGVNTNNFFVFLLEKNVIIPIDSCYWCGLKISWDLCLPHASVFRQQCKNPIAPVSFTQRCSYWLELSDVPYPLKLASADNRVRASNTVSLQLFRLVVNIWCKLEHQQMK